MAARDAVFGARAAWTLNVGHHVLRQWTSPEQFSYKERVVYFSGECNPSEAWMVKISLTLRFSDHAMPARAFQRAV
jgi:hypothetical protein